MSNINEIKVKFGYLSYDDMIHRIEVGEINEYDIIYSKDRLVTYIISENLEPIELHSRVYVFDSVEEAENVLNNAPDTYIGQVVAILYNDAYRGYIVNKDGDKYKITPLWENPDGIDYNTLGNRPIVNIVGTINEPIVVSELDDGIYSIKGHYKITDTDITMYLNPNNTLFLVQKSDENIQIKKISTTEIVDYVITDTVIKTNKIITEEFLNKKGYATTNYVDDKIAALDIISREEIQEYVNSIIAESIDGLLDDRIDARIDEKIQGANEEQIRSLFKN